MNAAHPHPPRRPCPEAGSACLRLDTFAVVFTLTDEECQHVADADVPWLLWQIASRARDPYAAINALIGLSVQHADPAGSDTN